MNFVNKWNHKKKLLIDIANVELLNNDNVQVAIGSNAGLFGKILLILLYTLLLNVLLKLISIWDEFSKK